MALHLMPVSEPPTATDQALRKINLGYVARPQFTAFHARTQRWACIVAHRRAGKTVACVMDLIDAALRCTKQDGRFSYISPTYTQSKDNLLALSQALHRRHSRRRATRERPDGGVSQR